MQRENVKTKIWHIAFSVLGLFYSLMEVIAQSPTHIDTRRKDPKPFTLDDILLYIVFPVLLFVAAIVARRYQKKLKDKADKQKD